MRKDCMRTGISCTAHFFQTAMWKKGFKHLIQSLKKPMSLPRQMHTYMETEGGVAVPEDDGGFTMYAGTQHGYKDRFQLARIFDIPEEKIRIVSSPMGGSFGGKDEPEYSAVCCAFGPEKRTPCQNPSDTKGICTFWH